MNLVFNVFWGAAWWEENSFIVNISQNNPIPLQDEEVGGVWSPNLSNIISIVVHDRDVTEFQFTFMKQYTKSEPTWKLGILVINIYSKQQQHYTAVIAQQQHHTTILIPTSYINNTTPLYAFHYNITIIWENISPLSCPRHQYEKVWN